jgi:two-component system, response regulator PdtaR
MRVLVIDDHPPSKSSVTRALNEEGCDVVGEGTDGKTAVELVKIVSPDVVLMAVGLPDMDGISVARRIMAERPLPILLLTSHYDRATVEEAKKAGVMACLTKPLRKEELVPNIELATSRFAEIMSLRKENANLKKTLESRKAIERAKGILMKNGQLSEGEAFSLMQRKSMNTHKPMVEIAQAIILTEEMVKK